MLLLCPQVCSSVYIRILTCISANMGFSSTPLMQWLVFTAVWIHAAESRNWKDGPIEESVSAGLYTFKHRSKDKNVERVSQGWCLFLDCYIYTLYIYIMFIYKNIYIYIVYPKCELVTWCPIFYICNARSFPQSSASGVAVLSWCNMARRCFSPLCGWNWPI